MFELLLVALSAVVLVSAVAPLVLLARALLLEALQ